VKTSQLDDVDRQLLHALIMAPRASFRQLAGVLDVSDQTIARRYRRLAETAGLRVFGLVDGQRAGWVDWLVRLQATPGSAQRIADTLASRPDTRWVRLYSGGTEIVCTLQATGLSPAQLDALHAAVPPPGPARVQPAHGGAPADPGDLAGPALRPEDDLLLAELARDGRASVADLSAATHWHESTVRRRIDELRQAGLLYFDIDVDETYLGIRANVMLWLKVEPASLDAAGRALAGHQEIPFAAATTGTTNLVASAVFPGTRQLYAYLTTRLSDLPGLQSVESAPIIGTVKRIGRSVTGP
jgi:DNA-binding Lrp family transcriptional regulator